MGIWQIRLSWSILGRSADQTGNNGPATALWLHYGIRYPEEQTNRLDDIMLGEKRTPSRAQQIVLRRLGPVLL